MSPRFTEQWFGDASCQALADLARETNHLQGDVIEIGSWEGRSTIALAEAVHPSMVHAVDTWRGSEGEISRILAFERDVYARFLDNTRDLNVLPYRMDWRDYVKRHDTRPIRFCFIDGLHTYEEVRDQLAAIRTLIVPGGIVCGDDNHHPPIQQAVVEADRDAQVTATLWVIRC